MRERYTHAARLTAPKLAVGTTGATVAGYWLDDHRYFFLAEERDPRSGHIVTVPSIADLEARRVAEVISLESLSALLTAASGEVDAEALAAAMFDMPAPEVLGVSLGAREYLVSPTERRVIETRAALGEPALYSPDGRSACVVRGNDIWLQDRRTGRERPLTTSGTSECRIGQQPETCLAAVSYRRRPVPMGLWSADSQWFLTHVIDERGLPDLTLVEHAPADGGRPALHRYKYAMPGDPLPMVTYVAVHVASGRVVTFEEFPAPAMTYSPFYLRMVWFSGRGTAWFLRFDRFRRSVALIELDLESGGGRVVMSEEVESGYIDLNPMYFRTPNVRTLPKSAEVIWFSEADGWGHLYLHDAATGRLKNRITRGDWVVRDIVHVDEAARRLLFLAGGIDPETDPLRRSLCSIGLDGSGLEILCSHDGDVFVPPREPTGFGQYRPHRPADRPPGVADGHAVVRFASAVRGNVTAVVDLTTRAKILTIASACPASEESAPRQFSVLAADGVTRLYGLLFVPADLDESKRYPLIDYIYPGPQTTHQPQTYRSTNSSQAAALAELGFVTMMLDTRGMPGRSRAFHQTGYGNLLEPQLADHAAAVRQLCERYSFIDADRVGIFGWSAGGAAAFRALCDYGSTFKVGVAVCGSHDSSAYAAGWSDRYRGPADADAWAGQANADVAHKLHGKLLLVSGDVDENVHVSQTLSVVNALVAADRDFELLIIPNAGHDVLMTNAYVQRRMWDYFVRHLLDESPAGGGLLRFEPEELRRYAEQAERELRE